MDIVVLLGPPAVGKGTQARHFQQDGFFHFSAGEYLRARSKQGDALGDSIAAIMNAGDLVPGAVVTGAVRELLDEKISAGGIKGLLLDGFPRSLDQAEEFAQIVAARNLSLKVIELTADQAVLDERHRKRRQEALAAVVVSGTPPERNDDDDATFRHRMETYRQETAPVSAYYAGTGALIQVDATKEAEAVRAAICQALEKPAASFVPPAAAKPAPAP